MDKRNKKREIIVPIICVLLSIGLWFYITNIENPIKLIEINKVPVTLKNVEYLKDFDLTLAPNQNFYVNLKVEGLGNQIYKLGKSDFNIQIDLHDYALKKGQNKIPVTIISSPANVNIKNDNALTVTIVLEELSEKNIPISSDVNANVKQGFFASKPEIDPKEVTVSGPKSLVDSVDKVVAFGEVNDVSIDVSEQYPLKAINDEGKEIIGVSLSIEEAKVYIKVTKGKSVPVKINTIGQLPANIKLGSLEASRKTIEIVGSNEVISKIKEVYSTQLDLSTINESKKVSLKIIVPEGVKIIPGEEFVDVNITVSKVADETITKEFEIPISINGQAEGITITPKNQTVKVVISGKEELVNAVKVESFKGILNVNSYNEAGKFEGTPEVTMEGVDSSITITSIGKIAFTVTKEPNDKPVSGEANGTEQ